MKRLLLLFVLTTLLLIGCSDKSVESNKNIQDDNDKVVENKDDKNDNIVDEKDIDNKEEVIQEGIKSPLSGLYGEEDKINRRPIAIIFDNHVAAKWQSGLSQAEIVYEILAEGTITRYMGLFLREDPNLIGAIRSARPYFIEKALEYDSIFVHCGGSEQAYADIKKLKVSNLDEIRNAGYAFFRYYDTGKKNEHTLYSSMDKLRDAENTHGYRSEAKFSGFLFNEKDTDIEGIDANSILIKYYNDNYTKYEYDKENKVYKRYKKYRKNSDLELHIDEYDGKVITAKNIIIQKAETKVIDNYGRRSIQLVGSGTGHLITNGKAIEVTWKKESIKDKTRYYNQNGEEIVLNPGVTWIQLTQNSTKVEIN